MKLPVAFGSGSLSAGRQAADNMGDNTKQTLETWAREHLLLAFFGLAVVFFHSSMNTMNPLMGMFPITTIGNVLLVVFAVVVVVLDRMWNRLPKNHLAVQNDVQTINMNASAA
jgi:hypothetical protein